MNKRGKLEIMRDILKIIQDNKNIIKLTPLLRKSNISSSRFKEYYNILLEKEFIGEINKNENRYIIISEKGFRFLEKYKAITDFIDEFEL